MRLSAALAMLTLVVASCPPLPAAHAQGPTLEVRTGDTVKSVLERLIGQRVSVVLTSGPELSGVVTSVSEKVVLLKDLTNRTAFDGVVNIDQIGAVIVRTRSR
jgi:small nuclear ribonucleoprotein (snRNP)-like protein